MKFSKMVIAYLCLLFSINCNSPIASRTPIEFSLLNSILFGQEYSLGGTVVGLTGIGFIIQNNSKDDLAITQNGNFIFNKKFSNNDNYSVSIKTQPLGQTCSISQASGVITANVNTITVDCIKTPVIDTPPSALTYSGSPYTYTQNTAIVANTPTFTGTITICTASPALPIGLSINNSTCAITGTPTATQVATTYTITASNTLGNTTASINITVSAAPPSALTYIGSPYTYTQNIVMATNTPTFTGTITNCLASPALPIGLVINNTTCAISGTPTVIQGATTYTITASNAYGNTSTSISITINNAAPSALTYIGSPYTYTQNLAITTNTPTITGTPTSCSAAPALPAGLIIDNITCAISGTPTATQVATAYTITASNAFGNTTASINITVNLAPPSSLVYTGSPYTYIQNTAIATTTPTVSGTVTSCSASPILPAGLSINSTTCAISGTPIITQSAASHTITASNAFGSTTTSIDITVNIPAPSALSYTGNPYSYTQNAAIAANIPTVTGTVTSCSAAPALPAGLVINNTTCEITGTPTTTQGATVYTITASNISGSTTASITITINIAPPSALTYTGSPYTYTQNAAIAVNTPTVTGSVTTCSSAPGLPAGLIINNTTCAISGTPTTTQGATAYTITASNAFGSTTASINITVNIAPPSALTYSGSSYTYTQNAAIAANIPTVTGTVTSCSAAPALPAGLIINNTTCTITGTPTVTQGAITYTITASNAFGSTTASIDITINIAAPSALTYTASPYTYTENSAIATNTPTVTGAVTSCSAAPALPTGLSINNITCAISGVPTVTQGATAYTITASNAFGSTTASINITVNLAPPSALTYTGSPYTYTQNAAIVTNTPTVTGTVTTCSSAPPLPAGLSINNITCAISGTPTTSQGATAYTITASNAFGSTTASINITVNGLPPSALTYTGSPYTYIQNTLIATNTPTVTGTVTTCSSAPPLPAGLSINNTTCAITGTPTVTQVAAAYTITATNAFGNTTASINITVTLPAPTGLSYIGSPYIYGQTLTIATNTPTVTGTVTTCSAAPPLPAGLSINNTTCSITGVPTTLQGATAYTITASNISGSTTVSINISVQDLCVANGGTGTATSCLLSGQVMGTPLVLAGNVTTPYGPLPGSIVSGTTNAIGNAARFFSPFGITTDRVNLYVAEWDNNQIRKIDMTTGMVTLLAGSITGAIGSTNGIGTAAKFSAPGGIATDGVNLYVADSYNHTIRMINIATANVTTLAGTVGVTGLTNATGTAAKFSYPYGITSDGVNVYVADYGNNVIRKIVIATKVVTTLAGQVTAGFLDGTGTAAKFDSPFGLTTDGPNLYVSDEFNNRVRKIVISTGVVTTLAGQTTAGLLDGTGTAAKFNAPEGITTDGTNLFLMESGNNVVRKIVIATGVVTTIAGSGAIGDADGASLSATFNTPQGLVSDGVSLYIADWSNNKIRKVN